MGAGLVSRIGGGAGFVASGSSHSGASHGSIARTRKSRDAIPGPNLWMEPTSNEVPSKSIGVKIL
jgi:hypothetical protein